MKLLASRIRQARLMSKLTQAELARRIGVKRSAVTQWEHPLGTKPSIQHLIDIAMQTGTRLEWLATARGSLRYGENDTLPTTLPEDHPHDSSESEALLRFRQLPAAKRKIALDILQVLLK